MFLAIEHKRSLQDKRTGDFAPKVYPPKEGAQALPSGSPHKPFDLELETERFMVARFTPLWWASGPKYFSMLKVLDMASVSIVAS
jgi:hypothetical protein